MEVQLKLENIEDEAPDTDVFSDIESFCANVKDENVLAQLSCIDGEVMNIESISAEIQELDPKLESLALLHEEIDIKDETIPMASTEIEVTITERLPQVTEQFINNRKKTVTKSLPEKNPTQGKVLSNTVAFLLENPRLKPKEKLKVKTLQRPTPHLDLEHAQCVKGRQVIRKFKINIYQKNNWLCGCDIKNALFCFPCLLFGGDPAWSRYGVTDLVHLAAKISKHQISEDHLENSFSLTMLGKNNIQNALDSTYRMNIHKHNEEVMKNRHILNIIINCIRFCRAFELALRGHDERNTTYNKGIFRELINFSEELDNALKEHIERAPVFKGSSKTIQNEILDIMMQVYHEHVANEIKSTDDIAIIAGETTDVSNQFQLVIVLRYIVNMRPVERFWKFLQPSGHDAKSLSTCILDEINLLITDTEKLIAQSYDGAAVMSGAINGLQKKVQAKYPRAKFVHCFPHQTNLIMSNATSSNSNCRIFFANLTGLCSFFSASPQLVAKFEESLKNKNLAQPIKIKWNFNSKTVNTVYEHREELIDALEEIERTSNMEMIILQAGAHLRSLEDQNFIYWLNFFHKIMPHFDILFNKLQNATTDVLKIKNKLHVFKLAIRKIQSEIMDEVNNQNLATNENHSELTPPSLKRKRGDENEKRNEAIKVCDIILLEMKTRFQFTGHLILAELISVKKFSTFESKFPNNLLLEAIKYYPSLSESRLRTELRVLYSRKEFRQNSQTSPVALLCLLMDGLNDTFYETVKLLKIIITIPMTKSETECFSRLERIKAFLRNTMKEDRLNALSMLSCEKEFINEIPNFNEKVIELFCKSETRKVDFRYLQI